MFLPTSVNKILQNQFNFKYPFNFTTTVWTECLPNPVSYLRQSHVTPVETKLKAVYVTFDLRREPGRETESEETELERDGVRTTLRDKRQTFGETCFSSQGSSHFFSWRWPTAVQGPAAVWLNEDTVSQSAWFWPLMLIEILELWLWRMFNTLETNLVNPFCMASLGNVYKLWDYVQCLSHYPFSQVCTSALAR